MIFTVSAKIEEIEATSRGEVEELFAQLIEADRRGKHFFVLNREMCKWAQDNLALSGICKTHLTKVFEQYSIRAGLLEIATRKVKVCFGHNGVQFDAKTGTYSVSHRELREREIASYKTAFVIEHGENDAKLYAHLLNEAAKQTSVPSHSFEPIHAGGSSLPAVFKAQVVGGRIGVCIGDSDKYAPCDRLSHPTSEAIKFAQRCNVQKAEGTKTFVGEAFATIGRELENHIPFYIIASMPTYTNTATTKTLIKRLAAASLVQKEEYWQYFDIKDGLNGEELKKKVEDGRKTKEVISWMASKLGVYPLDIW